MKNAVLKWPGCHNPSTTTIVKRLIPAIPLLLGLVGRLSSGYGWDYILSSADFICMAELHDVGTIKTGSAGVDGNQLPELLPEFKAAGKKILETPVLKQEQGSLRIGGISGKLGTPLMIEFINQIPAFYLLCFEKDEKLIREFAEILTEQFNKSNWIANAPITDILKAYSDGKI
ncbi:MAG: hypothetical protein K5697_07285 [Lachnospiraceae bacterium]|nr:hypothetical protein [Lachnospiraceae bacterium]